MVLAVGLSRVVQCGLQVQCRSRLRGCIYEILRFVHNMTLDVFVVVLLMRRGQSAEVPKHTHRNRPFTVKRWQS